MNKLNFKDNKVKIVISWILVILWMILIFFMSSQDSVNSDKSSRGTINKVIQTGVDISTKFNNKAKINKEKIINDLNHPIRKLAHMTEYGILAILIFRALNYTVSINFENNLKKRKLKLVLFSVLLVFLYAMSDEYHQTYINGRSGEFKDVLIDTLGGIILLYIYFGVNKLLIERKLKNINIKYNYAKVNTKTVFFT